MRLISLTSNKSSFHSVVFRRSGPSFIVGRQAKQAERNEDNSQTYNGVGKSLLLYLINYCLGAEPKEDFNKKLDGWEFTLRVEVDGHEVSITRKVSEPTLVQYGAQSLSLTSFRELLQEKVFPQAEDIKFLTLRSLIGSFLRPGKMAYAHWDGLHYSEKPVQKQIRSAFLLGLDVNWVVQKYNLVEELKSMKEMSGRFAKDPIIKEYFHGKKDVNLDIRDLEEQLATLEGSLVAFRVAENYHDVEVEVQDLKTQLQKVRNTAVALAAKLRQIEDSLKLRPDVSLTAVREVYEKAQIHFAPDLLRRLEEVEQFHSRLLVERKARLKKERDAHQQRLQAAETRMASLNGELDAKLRYLNEHGALGELLSLKDRVNAIGNQLQRLKDYKALTKKYKDRSAELQVELATASVEAAKYLDQNQPVVNAGADMFRKFARRIYPEKQCGLTIENDSGENQTRFKIDAKIISDASDGINEAKIFAYDLTLIALQRNHQVRFLCHDSRLFSDIDPRQRAEILRMAAEVSEERDFQYIATVNQDQIDAVRGVMGDELFRKAIGEKTVLELKDDSAEDKLLGIEVDIDYN